MTLDRDKITLEIFLETNISPSQLEESMNNGEIGNQNKYGSKSNQNTHRNSGNQGDHGDKHSHNGNRKIGNTAYLLNHK